MKKKIIKKTIFFANVAPHEIYETLMDSKKHAHLIGDEAKISREVGGNFTVFGEYASGLNLELIPDEKIVQSWRADDWPADHFSEVTFLLKPDKNGTKLDFTQIDVPEENYDSIEKGWDDYYWKPMREFFIKET